MTQSFTKDMRKATRDVHAISDALVNAKLIFALSDNNVWADGLLIFYDIFRFIEEVVENTKNRNLKILLTEEFFRTQAFEEDLTFYLGTNWKSNHTIRDAVGVYLAHLQSICNTDSDLLMAYIYHLYMGLLSGGQILNKKRQIKAKIFSVPDNEGYAVTRFNESIADLKSKLRQTMDSIASNIDDLKKEKLIEESRRVFELNNSIIKTVRGTGKTVVYNILQFVTFFIVLLIFLFYIFF